MAKTADHAQTDGMAPKEVGRQLRHVRRKQGLSRSEVARSAGLTRRELAAYERGRAEVPESDLWCLAGSCGVDVGELLPNRPPVKVSSDLSLLAIGDSIRYLRNPVDDDEMLREYLAMIYELRNLPPGSRIPLRERDLMALADALGGSPEKIEARLVELIGMSQEEAARLRAIIVPANALPAAADPEDAYAQLHDPDSGPSDAAVVDFFSTPRAPDMFEPPPPPSARPATSGWSDAFDTPSYVPVEPVAPAPVAPFEPDLASYEAPAAPMPEPEPPIPLDPFAAPLPEESYASDAVHDSRDEPVHVELIDEPAHVELTHEPLAASWPEPPAPLAPDTLRADDLATPTSVLHEPSSFALPPDVDEATFAPSPFREPPADSWIDAEPLPRRQPLHGSLPEPTDVVEIQDIPEILEILEIPQIPQIEEMPVPPVTSQDPVASMPTEVFEVPAMPVLPTDVPIDARASEPPVFAAPPPPPVPPVATTVPVTEAPDTAEAFVIPEPPVPAPGTAPIAWIAREQPAAATVQGDGFERAGSNWRIGGIFPATAMADDGALALRRADARWALADLDAPGDFTVEAIVDFSAGAGFGVLFRASVDESDRVSGYSFDIDPIAGGGGYLVRQWEDNRQHWRPIAQTGVTDPTLLFGRHTVTVSLRADQLSVVVDNDTVLNVPALSRCSVELGRAPCRGSRVGVQAWATTEVTINSFRVAQH